MNINTKIAQTYVVSNKKLTAVAVLGVLLGMSVYIFMNCMLVGFDKSSNSSIFKSTAHIRIYKDDEICEVIPKETDETFLIVNPKTVPNKNTILNPKMICELIQKEKGVKIVTPQVSSSVFYNNGKSQIAGLAVGIKPDEANNMFDIKSFIVEGNFNNLKLTQNGIIIGSGIASKMNLSINDNINLTSTKSTNKTFKVIGIFKTNNNAIDKSKAYINIRSAQELLQENDNFISDINVSVLKPDDAEKISKKLTIITGYKAESWSKANESLMAAFKMRKIVITFVSFTILLVAGFGIYNILNMTISQKINDIAILKAIGFKGKDVVQIFVTQAITIGCIGVVGGIIAAIILITILKNVYIGGDLGYFPIDYEFLEFLQGIAIGFVITFLAGYIPAKKAANIDPVSIFRK
ncbi:MAG: ABC transporter permease [Sphingobacteriaceae bacterium]|nr:ABC transporter permease [Sphingobacteriaceae bacterium]